MAIKAAVSGCPRACSGAHLVMRKRELRLRRGEILVRFCPPVDASQYNDGAARRAQPTRAR